MRMIAGFQIALGRGHAGASVSFDRSPAAGTGASRWPAVAAALLTIPFAVALALNILAQYTHAFRYESIPAWLFGAGPPGFGRVLSLGPPLALVILAAARLRIRILRRDQRWVMSMVARLERWEVAVGLVALLVAGLFFGHLIADGLACARGVSRAC